MLIESDPTSFFTDVLPDELRKLAALAARNFGGAAQDWVFCENATSAVNSVLSSYPLKNGDEILTTSHAYGAVLKAMQVWAERRNAKVAVAELPAIIESEDQVVEIVTRHFTANTKLLIIDHITSPTAAVFPVARIAKAARAAGAATLVDGAHAVGQVVVDVEAIGADWYTGNAHKWLFAPKGCGLLWTAPSRQGSTLPVILSHGARDGYAQAFDWIGTRDVTAWLCFKAATEAHENLGGIDLMARNRALAARAAAFLSANLKKPLSAPGTMCEAMASIQIGAAPPGTALGDQIRRLLLREAGIVLPIFSFAGSVWLRISAQIYNEIGDYERLAQALPKVLAQFDLL
ncbi:MAG TPA: aminotransferase class V-fold PLP-dependent enzyme [Rhizomicrobium sp.]